MTTQGTIGTLWLVGGCGWLSLHFSHTGLLGIHVKDDLGLCKNLTDPSLHANIYLLCQFPEEEVKLDPPVLMDVILLT